MSVEVPNEMIEEQLDSMITDYRQNAAMNGMEFGQYLGMMGMDEERFRAVLRPSAEKQARGEVLLESVAKAEGIELTEEDIEQEYKTAAENYQVALDEVKSAIPEELVRRDLRLRKAADLICDSAVVTDKKPEPEKEEEKAEEKTEEKPKRRSRKKAEEKTEEKAEDKPAEAE